MRKHDDYYAKNNIKIPKPDNCNTLKNITKLKHGNVKHEYTR